MRLRTTTKKLERVSQVARTEIDVQVLFAYMSEVRADWSLVGAPRTSPSLAVECICDDEHIIYQLYIHTYIILTHLFGNEWLIWMIVLVLARFEKKTSE